MFSNGASLIPTNPRTAKSNVCAGKNRVFSVLSKGSHLRNIIHRLGIIPQLHALMNSYQTLYQAMEAFEQDLHQHIHLENNVLFPRAVKMEG